MIAVPRGAGRQRLAAWLRRVAGGCVGGLGALLALVPAHARPDAGRLVHVDVLDAVVLEASLPAGLRLREVSGLAWDAAANELVTAGDRGVVARWMLDVDRRRLVSAWPVHAQRLRPGDRANAESIEVLPPPPGRPASAGRLLVADEAGHRLLVADWRGSVGVEPPSPLPGPPPSGSGRRAADGVEAVAWHVRHGLLVARQYGMPADAAARLHRVLATDGRSWTMHATPGGRASVKAMHLLDEHRLLLLEKVAGGGSRRLFLRELDLRACAAERPCDAAAAQIDLRGFRADDNFEGLACLAIDLCLIASDDGGHARPRTVLALLLLARGGAARAP